MTREEVDDLISRLINQYLQAHIQMQRMTRKMVIRPIEQRLLGFLGRNREGMRVSHIAGELEISMPMTTMVITHLEEGGYVQRVHSVKDRRVVYVSLTELGLVQLEEGDRQIREHIEKMVFAFGKEKTEQFIGLLEDWESYLQQAYRESASEETEETR